MHNVLYSSSDFLLVTFYVGFYQTASASIILKIHLPTNSINLLYQNIPNIEQLVGMEGGNGTLGMKFKVSSSINMIQAKPTDCRYGNTDNFGYSCRWSLQVDGANYFFYEASSSVVVPMATINSGITVDIGFPFNYYDIQVTQAHISKNGFIFFSKSSFFFSINFLTSIHSFFVLSTTSSIDWSIYPNTSNCILGSSVPLSNYLSVFQQVYDDVGTISYYSGGVAPNRFFVIQWNDLQVNQTGDFTFQAVLYEAFESIQFNYNKLDFPPAGCIGAMKNATIGSLSILMGPLSLSQVAVIIMNPNFQNQTTYSLSQGATPNNDFLTESLGQFTILHVVGIVLLTCLLCVGAGILLVFVLLQKAKQR